MAAAEETIVDIYDLEIRLREKINELQWKTESLEDTKKELSATRRTLYETQTELEDERRSSMELRIQVKTMLESLRHREEENMKNQSEQIHMKMKEETANIERAVLIEQGRTARLENIDLKLRIQEFEGSLVNSKIANESLRTSLKGLTSGVKRLHNKLESNLKKLESEQAQLRRSVESSVKFGQQLQANFRNYDHSRRQDAKRIDELNKKLRVFEVQREQTLRAGVAEGSTDIRTLQLQMDADLKELREKLEQNSADENLSLICADMPKHTNN